MKSKDIQNIFNQLAGVVQNWEINEARSLAQTLLNQLLKAAYAQVRGQVPPAVMRGLLDLEIAIGGEYGDFAGFDSRQMIDLFIRAELAGQMEKHFGQRLNLSAAVDLNEVNQWLSDVAHNDTSLSLASLRFIQAWLTLFALEIGLLDRDEADSEKQSVPAHTTRKAVLQLPDEEKPYIDPITGMTFVFIPGGTFSMGDTFDEGVEDEKPVHEVRLSAFYMATCPVTQAQWACLMPENPSSHIGSDHPVEQVTLSDVMKFIDKLNAASPGGLHFDLPSEAQWEYAARSGGKSELYAGAQDPEAVAWFDGNNTGSTAPVGTMAPNGLGLYDMSGNVWEWCRDNYKAEAYRQHGKDDPVCTKGDTDHVIRGGSWHLDAWSARCSRRFRFDPELFGPALGFRVVMFISPADRYSNR